MDHKFIPSQISPEYCAKCKYDEVSHTDRGTCDVCSNSGTMEIFTDMLMCSTCIALEMKATLEHQSPEKQEERLQAQKEKEAQSTGILNIGSLLDKARVVDYAVQVRTDIFNAETVAIADIKAAIRADDTIPATEKDFAVAKFLTERYEHYKKVVFEAQNTLVESQNKQRVIQQELNTIANALRAEEREKLKLLSPEYKPGAVKPASKPRTSKPKSFDKKELIRLAGVLQEEGLPVQWNMLQMTCVARDMTPVQAADFMRKTLGGSNENS